MSLALAIERKGPTPFALWIGQIAEAFNCRPSQAYEEWLQAPAGFLEEIIEARAFRDLYIAVTRASTADARTAITQGSELGALAGEIEFLVKRGR